MNFEEDSSDGGNYNAPAIKDYESSIGGGRLKRLQKLNGNLLLLFAFALVTVADAVVQADNSGQEGGQQVDAGPAIGVAGASLVITLLRYGHSLCVEDELSPGFQLGVAMVLLVVWVAGIIVLTFQDGGTFANIISSGFFSTWACLLIAGLYVMSTAAEANKEGSCNPQGCCCGLDIKKGITGNVGISIILCITVIILTSGEGGSIGGILGMMLSILILLVLATMICVPYEKYGNLDKFTFIMIVITVLSFVIVLLTTLGEPFAQRPVAGGPLELNGNGYFSVVGLFMSLTIMLWNSHIFILYFNRDEGGDFGVQGRYIWGSLLAGAGIVTLAAGAIECGNFGGCGENDFLLPMVALGTGTVVLVAALYCVGKENIDNGDDQILSPGSGFDFFDNNYQRLEFVGAFLLQIAWAAAAAAFTFAINSPFNTASNGYFFTWFGFFFASQYFSSIYPRFSILKLSCLDWEPPNGMERKNNLGLGLALFGVVVQFADVMVGVAQKLINEEDIATEDFAAFGTQFATLIAIIVLLCTRPERLGQCAVVLAYVFLLLAYVQLIVTTIVLNPFNNNEGNGFFAAWLIMFGAFYNLNHYEWGVKEEEF